MNITVTGGSGFIGSHIVDKLVKLKHKVRIIDIVTPNRKDVDYHQIDITNFNKLKNSLKGTDCVFHLAAISDINVAYKEPMKCREVNIGGTNNVLEISKQLKLKRFIFASTEWIYGLKKSLSNNGDFLIDDSNHIYTISKASAEMLIYNYNKNYNLPFTILRYGIPYGPRSRQGTLIYNFVNNALNNKPIIIYGDGLQFRKFLYISDLALANIKSLKPIAKNKTYNLNGVRKISVIDVANTIKDIMGNSIKIKYDNKRPSDFTGVEISSKKAKEELNWEPTTKFKEGMIKYINWIKKK
jgi:UDP-glucose 4-epimerase